MSLNLYGALNDLGYGIVTRGLAKGLLECGVYDYHLDPIGQPQLEDQGELQALQRNIGIYWKRDLPSVSVWHEFDLSRFSGKKLVAMPIFETTDFWPLAKSYLSQMDAVFVLSSWAKQVVENSIGNSVPVCVVPSAANLIQDPEVDATGKNSVFTFLSLGKLEKRKGHVELIQAYINAFKSSSVDTRLLLHCYNPFDQNFAGTLINIFNSLGLKVVNAITRGATLTGVCGNAIVEIPLGRLPAKQISKLYRFAHVGVFPSRAEGWNLPLMEGIQSGLPCIATDYSAHTEYLTEQYKYPQDLLLKNISMESAMDGVFFKGDRGDWGVLNLDAISEKMLYAYNNYDKIIKNFDNSMLKETFTWKNSALKLLAALESIS
jgi:glycosyltransferase involved in cell wall biosynthesis